MDLSDKKRRKSLIVPLFIPNQGCPHQCIYCQQEKITSQATQPVNESSVRKTLDKAIASPGFEGGRSSEVAFYGGTFTSLPIGRMKALLRAVASYLDQGMFGSIRVSTRPDSVHKEQLELMESMGVSTVELGTQSMDDGVLKLSLRGHTAKDTVDSVHLLREYGFKMGIQLMPGLPGDSAEVFLRGVEKVIKLRPDMVRLYPTIVIKGTELEKWYRDGRYAPWSLDEAVEVCGQGCVRLENSGIPVIRIGLMSSPSLLSDGEIVAGPWHRAFGFLVRSAIHQEKVRPCLPKPGGVSKMRLRVPPREIPLVRGYKNQGVGLIEERTGAKIAGVMADESVPRGQVRVDVL